MLCCAAINCSCNAINLKSLKSDSLLQKKRYKIAESELELFFRFGEIGAVSLMCWNLSRSCSHFCFCRLYDSALC